MPIMHVGSKRAIWLQAMYGRSRPRSVTPAVSPDECPGRNQTLEGDDEPEQRHGRGGAEAGRAAQRVGGDHHHAAIGNFEWGKRLDGRLRSQRDRAWLMWIAVGLQFIPRLAGATMRAAMRVPQ